MTAAGDDTRDAGPAGTSTRSAAPPVPWRVGPAAWPYGPGRPGEVTAAAVLGLCLAVPVGLGGLLGSLSLLGTGDDVAVVLVLALPVAAGLGIGSAALLRRRGRALLIGSGAATAAGLLALPLVDADLRGEGWAGAVATVLVWLPIPLVATWSATLPRVGDWLADRRPPPGRPLPYAPPPWGCPPELWPYGPPRPRAATVAVVLGLVTAGCVAWIAPFAVAVGTADSRPNPAALTLLLLGPCAAGMLAGAQRLLHRRGRGLLLGSALAAGTIVLGVLVAGLGAAPANAADLLVWAVLALPLPVLTASSAARQTVRDWLAAPAAPAGPAA